ncbi:hypothetical protein A8B90_00015 [Bordetella pertussis]|nr:hypothetical protein A8B90_00015 [Bordetella pertussis]
MDAVGLEHGPVGGDSFHEERHQPGFFLFGHGWKDLREALGVVAAVVRRDLHADHQHRCAGLARRLRHGAQIALGHVQRQAAQGIVGPQFQHDDGRRVLAQQRRQARQPAAGRIAADAGIDDAVVGGLLRNPLGQHRHPAGPARRPYSADRLSPTTRTACGAEPVGADAV